MEHPSLCGQMPSLEVQYSTCGLTCGLSDQRVRRFVAAVPRRSPALPVLSGTNLARGEAGVVGASPGGQCLGGGALGHALSRSATETAVSSGGRDTRLDLGPSRGLTSSG